MRAGRRDRRIQLLAKGEGASDALNDPAETWTPLTPTLSASWRQVRADEGGVGPARSQVLRGWFEVLSSAFSRSITTQHRIRFDGSDYEIAAIEKDGRRTVLFHVGATFAAPPA